MRRNAKNSSWLLPSPRRIGSSIIETDPPQRYGQEKDQSSIAKVGGDGKCNGAIIGGQLRRVSVQGGNQSPEGVAKIIRRFDRSVMSKSYRKEWMDIERRDERASL